MQNKLDSDKEAETKAINAWEKEMDNKPIYGDKDGPPKETEKPKMDFDNPDFLKPYRLDTETPYQYKVRRLLGNLYTKNKKKGQYMWISKDLRQPVYSEADQKEMLTMSTEDKAKVKPLGYQISKGFTYNKTKVKAAIDKYLKEKEVQELSQKSNINTNK